MGIAAAAAKPISADHPVSRASDGPSLYIVRAGKHQTIDIEETLCTDTIEWRDGICEPAVEWFGKLELVAAVSGPIRCLNVRVEVVVTPDTIIYRDETEIPVGEPGEQSGERTIQQVVKLIHSLEEVGKNFELQVWGERRGDRVVAEVLVYKSLPVPDF